MTGELPVIFAVHGAPVPLVYDFYGIPERYYRTSYPAPGAPALAVRVRQLFDAAGIPWTDEPERGLDHGAYVPLVAMYPKADVPVLQVSLPAQPNRAGTRRAFRSADSGWTARSRSARSSSADRHDCGGQG